MENSANATKGYQSPVADGSSRHAGRREAHSGKEAAGGSHRFSVAWREVHEGEEQNSGEARVQREHGKHRDLSGVHRFDRRFASPLFFNQPIPVFCLPVAMICNVTRGHTVAELAHTHQEHTHQEHVNAAASAPDVQEEEAVAKTRNSSSSAAQAFLTALQERGVRVVLGSEGDDRFWGGQHSAISAGAGNDTIAVWGHSAVDSGAGDDVVWAGTGSFVDAGEGNDRVYASSNSDVSGGDGDDRLSVWRNSSVSGGQGDDFITAWSGSTVDGGEGDDRIFAGPNADIDGGEGDDFISAWGGSRINGGAGNDRIAVSGNSVVSGGAGDDEIWLIGRNSQVRFDAGDGFDHLIMRAGGTIQIGSGFSADDAEIQIEGRVATVRFKDSDEGFQVTLRPGRTVDVVFENGGTLTLEPEHSAKPEVAHVKEDDAQTQINSSQAAVDADVTT